MSINTTNNNDYTPLHTAALKGDIETVKLLLDHDANINAVDNKYNITSLHIAANEDYQDIVKLLLDHDANVNAVDINGDIPLDIATSKGHTEIIELIKTHCTKEKS